ncbi:MAG TPA: hypothetical protein VHM30_14850 [Gemmatimonadaceae bacterium]|nr:hypothetical protein [Gemmatimonadaceae bacterium]
MGAGNADAGISLDDHWLLGAKKVFINADEFNDPTFTQPTARRSSAMRRSSRPTEVSMRATFCSLAVLVLASSAAAQTTAPVRPAKTTLSIQPIRDLGNDDDPRGPRLELERAVTRRLAVVLGTQLTVRNSSYLLREPVFRRLDLGVRYYPTGIALRGPFLGAYGGYDRVIRGYTIDTHRRVPVAIAGATAGWNFRLAGPLVFVPSFSLEYGRPDALDGSHRRPVTAAPRLGFGITFE